MTILKKVIKNTSIRYQNGWGSGAITPLGGFTPACGQALFNPTPVAIGSCAASQFGITAPSIAAAGASLASNAGHAVGQAATTHVGVPAAMALDGAAKAIISQAMGPFFPR